MKNLFFLLIFVSLFIFGCTNDFLQNENNPHTPEFQSVFKGCIYCKLRVLAPPSCTEYIACKVNTFNPDGIVLNKIHTDESVSIADLSQAKFNFNQDEFYNCSGVFSVQVELGEFKENPCVDYFSIIFYKDIFDKLFVNPFYCGGFISHYNENLEKAFMNNLLDTQFYIARTETTFSEWKAVYDWAVNNGFSFKNSGNLLIQLIMKMLLKIYFYQKKK